MSGISAQYVDGLEFRIKELGEQVEKLTGLVVMRFDHDVPPQFSQGYSEHEMVEPVTAAHCKWFVGEIVALREQVEKLKAELKSIDGALNDPRANLTLTTSEIIWELKGQVEKLTKERDALFAEL